MKTLFHFFLIFCVAVCTISAVRAEAPVDSKPLDAMLDKALAGYNANDHTAFYGDFAKMMASIATQQVFNTMYRGMYFTTYGKYVTRTPIKEQTVLLGDSPLLVYAAEFEKNKKVKLSVNFIKEEGVFKIMQIQLGPL